MLDYDERHRRRMAMTGARGTSFLLDLPAAAALRDGDALVLDDGRLVEVVAAPEPLLEIRCTDRAASRPRRLASRQPPSADAVLANALRIRRDHVLADMLRGLGATVTEIEAPFDPEGGAYAGAASACIISDNGHRHDHHGHVITNGGHDHGRCSPAIAREPVARRPLGGLACRRCCRRTRSTG